MKENLFRVRKAFPNIMNRVDSGEKDVNQIRVKVSARSLSEHV